MTVSTKKYGFTGLALLVIAAVFAPACAGPLDDQTGEGMPNVADPNRPTPDGTPVDEDPETDRPAVSDGKLVRSEILGELEHRSYAFRHPKFHGVGTRRAVSQRVEVLIPAQVRGRHDQVPVVLLLGGHGPTSTQELLKATELPRFFRAEAVYVSVEHRGYGLSLSDDADQSVPDYVSYEQAVEDAHAVIEDLRVEFQGPWMVVGHGYAGSLAVELGALHPHDAVAFGASSAPLLWEGLLESEDAYARAALGADAFDQASVFMTNLKPRETFDRNWRTRETFEALIAWMAESPEAANFKAELLPLFREEPETALAKLRALSEDLPGGASILAQGEDRAVKRVLRSEAISRDLSARTWRYQQCAELGAFRSSPTGDGVFVRTAEQHSEECASTFGAENVMRLGRGQRTWSLEENLARFGEAAGRGAESPTLVLVAGGEDPWSELGARVPNWTPRVETDHAAIYDTHYGAFIDAPAGKHTPDMTDANVAVAFWGELFGVAREHSPEAMAREAAFDEAAFADVGEIE